MMPANPRILVPPVTLYSLPGLWKRRRICWPDGREDVSTQVHWLQVGRHYADLRIPTPRPSFACARSLPDCTPDQLRWLARQQGFAGTMEQTPLGWHWVRELDYQPFTGRRDIGRLRYADPDSLLMIEDGVEESYVEEWERMSLGGERSIVMVLQTPGGSRGYLVASGRHFIYALDRRPALPPANSLEDLLPKPFAPSSAPIDWRWCDMEISMGAALGYWSEWTVSRSTFPWREGRPLFEDQPVSFDPGTELVSTGSYQWRIVERDQNITAPPFGLMHWPVK